MKLILRLFFLLMPVFANCQTSEHAIQPQPGNDSLLIPSLNREWSASDFQEVYKIIISKQNDTSAEIITIDKNKPLFEKLTNIRNYWFLESKYHTLNERFSFNLSLQNSIKTVFLNYYQKSKIINGRLRYDREIAVFSDLLFEITKNQMELADEFIKASPNLTQQQLDGIKQMALGINGMVAGALQTIEKEYTYFSEASICRISSAFKDFYSFMYNRIDQESKTEFDRRIAHIIKTHAIPCVRIALQTNQKKNWKKSGNPSSTPERMTM